MRIAAALGFWVVLTGLAWAQDNASSRPMSRNRPTCPGETRQDRLDGVTPEGDLVLGSGDTAKLSGLRLPDDPVHGPQALEWLRTRIGQKLSLTIHGRDRWNRFSVRAQSINGRDILDLGHGLAEAGLAVADPGTDAVFCQPELLAIEETARERRLGLWTEARYNPIPVDQTDRLKESIGRFVIVEGRVRSVGERKQRTYLNFGGHWADDFTIIVPRKTWLQMAQRGVASDSLKGRKIRARGILQSWQGTALTIDLPEMIEGLEGHRLQDRQKEGERLAR